MIHLGVRVSAYVDGQLPVSLTERVTAHLAACVVCREAVERERRTKGALLAMPDPSPATDFMLSLVAMGGPSGPDGPRAGHVPGSPRPPLVTFEADARRDPRLSLAPSGVVARGMLRRRWGGALIGAATVVGAGVLSATLLPLVTVGGAGVPVRQPSGSIAVTPGSPWMQQNVVRRFGSRGWPAVASPGAPATGAPVVPAPVSTGPLTPGGWNWASSASPFAVALR